MKNVEGNASKEALLSDATQLAIRDEVEKRVEQREAIYWKFGGLFVAVVILFFAVQWKVSISEIRETVEKQLAEKGIIFCSFTEAVQEHPELVKKYLGMVVPYTDNYFAALQPTQAPSLSPSDYLMMN